MKVVINDCHGGFDLSREACEWLVAHHDWGTGKIPRYGVDSFAPEFRSNPDLVAVVEALGEAANGECSKLKIVEIPDGVEFEIHEHAGAEWIAEKHRTWE